MDYKIKIIIFSFVFLSFSFSVLASTDLFFDGFESDDFTKWTLLGPNWVTVTNAGGAHSGSNRAEIKGISGGTTGDSILYKQISTAGYQNIVLNYWYKIGDKLEEEKHIIVEWSVDGTSWNQLKDFSNIAEGNWTDEAYSLPTATFDKSGFGFRFRAISGLRTSDIFRLDDVYLKGDTIFTAIPPPPVPEPTQTPPAPEPQPEVIQFLAETQTSVLTPVQEFAPLSEPTVTLEPILEVELPEVEEKIIAAPPTPKKQTKRITKKETVKKEIIVPPKIELPLQAAVEPALPQSKNLSFNYLIYALTIGIVSVIVVLKLMKFLV